MRAGGPLTKRRRTSCSPLPENLTHTAQSSLAVSELASDPVAVQEQEAETSGRDGTNELTEDEMFQRVTRPLPIDGLEDWGIPPAVDPGECDPALIVSSTSDY